MRDDCYEEEGDAEYYDGTGYEVVEACEYSDDDFLGSSEVGFLEYWAFWVFHIEDDVEQVADLARVSATEEGSDEALDEDKGESPQIYPEVGILDGH